MKRSLLFTLCLFCSSLWLTAQVVAVKSDLLSGVLTSPNLGVEVALSPRWGLETSIGVGYVRTSYESFRCIHCGEQTGSGSRNYMGPTKVAVSLIYVIK